jgi:hypothetical protein
MKRIGLLSDTHTFLHPRLKELFADCDEIWHAGDIGNTITAEQLDTIKPLKAVYGNIDGQDIRIRYPEVLSFFCEEVKVLIIHIGGYPKRYSSKARSLIKKEKPKLFISGHSHILKVMYDQEHKLLHVNPGAAGKSGFHKVITAIRFTIDKSEIKDLEVIELKK